MPSTKLWFYGADNNALDRLWHACYQLHNYTRKCARVIIAERDECPTEDQLRLIVDDLKRGRLHPIPPEPCPYYQNITAEQVALIHEDLIPGLLEETLYRLPADLHHYRRGKSRWWTRWRDFTSITFPVTTIHFENDMLLRVSSGGRARIFNRGMAKQIRAVRDAGRVEEYEITRGRTSENFYTFTLHVHTTPQGVAHENDSAGPASLKPPRPRRETIRLELPLEDMITYTLRHPDNPDALLETAQLLDADGEHAKSLPLALLALLIRKRAPAPKKLKPLVRTILGKEAEHPTAPPASSYPF